MPIVDITHGEEDGLATIRKSADGLWLILQLPPKQVERICKTVNDIKKFTRKPFNDENQLFFKVDRNNIMFWNSNDATRVYNVFDENNIISGRAFVVLQRFTELEDGTVGFKVDVKHFQIDIYSNLLMKNPFM